MGTVTSGAVGRWFAAVVTVGALALAGLVGGAATAAADTLSISGTLLDPAGSPAANAQVEVLTLDLDYAGSATTDDTGHWEVYDLPAGQYKVGFYYGGASSWAYGKAKAGQADPITVTDAEFTVVNDRMPPIPPPTQVSGLIRDAATKAPLSGICVSYAPPTDPASRSGQGCSGPDGRYTLDVADPGHWVLVAKDETGKYVAVVSKPFDIGAGQLISGKNLTLSLGGGLEGTVVDRVTGKPLVHICPNVSLGHRGDFIVGQVENCSNSTGKWSVIGLPAGRRVSVELGGDSTHVALWAPDAATQKTAKLFVPTVGKFVSTGTLGLHHGAVLTGKVTTVSGRPVVGAIVEVGGASDRCGAPCSPFYAVTSKTGTYTITNIDPQQRIASASAFEQPLATAYSGGVSNPDVAKKLTFRFDGSGTFNAVMLPEARLQVKVTGVPGTGGTLLDAFSSGGARLGVSSDLATPNGTATISNLPGGKVKLQLLYGDAEKTIWYDNATTLQKARAISLKTGKTTKIAFAVSVPR